MKVWYSLDLWHNALWIYLKHYKNGLTLIKLLTIKTIKISPNLFQGRAPKFTQGLQPRSRNELPARTAQTTATPDIKNTTVTPNVTKGRQSRAILWPGGGFLCSTQAFQLSSSLTLSIFLQLIQKKAHSKKKKKSFSPSGKACMYLSLFSGTWKPDAAL